MDNNLCNICRNNQNDLHKIEDFVEVNTFQESVKLCIPNIVFSNNISIYLCSNCYEGFKGFNKFYLLCIKNEINMRQLFLNIKTEFNTDVCEENHFESVYVPNIKEESQISNDKDIIDFNYENTDECRKYTPQIKLEVEEQPMNDEAFNNDNTHPTSRESISINKKRRKSHNCTQCNKSFSSSSDLKSHFRTHTKEKPFTCPECGNTFTKRSSLNKHVELHSGRKPFSCQVCEKKFATASNLKSHETVHLDDDDRPYICKDCGRGFRKKSYLVGHLRIHSGEKPYICNDCGRSFNQHSILVNHSRLHSGEKPFACDLCDQKFAQTSHLNYHRRTKHNF